MPNPLSALCAWTRLRTATKCGGSAACMRTTRAALTSGCAGSRRARSDDALYATLTPSQASCPVAKEAVAVRRQRMVAAAAAAAGAAAVAMWARAAKRAGRAAVARAPVGALAPAALAVPRPSHPALGSHGLLRGRQLALHPRESQALGLSTRHRPPLDRRRDHGGSAGVGARVARALPPIKPTRMKSSRAAAGCRLTRHRHRRRRRSAVPQCVIRQRSARRRSRPRPRRGLLRRLPLCRRPLLDSPLEAFLLKLSSQPTLCGTPSRTNRRVGRRAAGELKATGSLERGRLPMENCRARGDHL